MPHRILLFLPLLLLLTPRIAGQQVQEQTDLQTFASYADVGYDQSLRPQFHFSSRENWLNDPNGLVYYDGEYHLYFQHNPLDVHWGNMTWGHAVSTDLVHWRQLPHAILPYDGGTIFSGTAVVDHSNSLGAEQGDAKTLAAVFTFAREPFYQALAYSSDRGRTFQLWNDGKPVLPNQGYNPDERDPKVFWHAASGKWVMVLWVKQDQPGRVLVFNSDDLRHWKKVGQVDRDWVFECMDLVELPVDGDPQNKRWVLYDASFEYEIGQFDGKHFTSDKQWQRGDFGPNYYAAQSFNNMPDDRRVMIGWMRGDADAPFLAAKMPFNMQLSFPTTMKLRQTPQGLHLFRWPVAEISRLYDASLELADCRLTAANAKLRSFAAELVDFSVEFAPPEKRLVINVRGEEVIYSQEEFVFRRSRIPAPAVDGVVAVRILVDRASLELFANRGAAVATFYATPDPQNRSIQFSSASEVEVRSLEVHRLNSIWPR